MKKILILLIALLISCTTNKPSTKVPEELNFRATDKLGIINFLDDKPKIVYDSFSSISRKEMTASLTWTVAAKIVEDIKSEIKIETKTIDPPKWMQIAKGDFNYKDNRTKAELKDYYQIVLAQMCKEAGVNYFVVLRNWDISRRKGLKMDESRS